MLRFVIALSLVLCLPLTAPIAGSSEVHAHPATYSHRHQSVPPRSRRAKRVKASPYYLSLTVIGNFVAPEERSDMSQVLEAGGGASLIFGRRINRYLAFEASAFVTFHQAGNVVNFNTGALAGFTADTRIFILPSARRFEPYVQLGLGSYLLAREGMNELLQGIGLQGGVGIDLNLNPMMAIGVKALYRSAYLDNRMGHWNPFPRESAFVSMVTGEIGLTIRL